MKNIVLNINKVKCITLFLWLVLLSPVRNIFLLQGHGKTLLYFLIDRLLFDLSYLNLWYFLNITYGEMSSKFIISRFVFISLYIIFNPNDSAPID